MASDKGLALVIMWDFSAAFDTIDHEITLQTLEYGNGIKLGLLDRFFLVHVNNDSPMHTKVSHRVLLGFVLGPILYASMKLESR